MEMTETDLEKLELKYLNKYYYFLKFAIDEILEGLKTKDKISNDWKSIWGTKISSYSTGAERVIFSLLNGKGIGIPNSSPVGSDLFFEVKDAFIHIDLKTVGTKNIGDFDMSIFIGTNQNSYKHHMLVYEKTKKELKREYIPHLPAIYNKKNKKKAKHCLSYFITILYDSDTAETLVVNIMCMPNGELNKVYRHEPLKAGKNLDETRFNFSRVDNFRLIEGEKRIKVVFFKKGIHSKFKSLSYQYDLYKNIQ